MEQKEGLSDEINLFDYLKVIQRHKKLIIIIIAISVVVSVVRALLTPPVYEAKAIITPASQQNAPSGMGVLAMQFGIAASTQSSVTEIVNLLNSNILREKVIKK